MLLQAPFPSAYELHDIGPHLLAELPEFHEINPAFTTLDLRHKRLGTPEPFRQLCLRQAGLEAQIAQDPYKGAVLLGVNRGPSHSTIQQPRAGYPKSGYY